MKKNSGSLNFIRQYSKGSEKLFFLMAIFSSILAVIDILTVYFVQLFINTTLERKYSEFTKDIILVAIVIVVEVCIKYML